MTTSSDPVHGNTTKPVEYIFMEGFGENKVATRNISIKMHPDENRIEITLDANFTLDETIVHSDETNLKERKWVVDAAYIFYLFMKEKGKV